MTNTEIEELKKLAESATPGKWICSHGGYGTKSGFKITEYFVMRSGDDVSIAADIVDPSGDNHMPSEANAKFIAEANPQAILSLIAELEQYKKDAERLNWIQSQTTLHTDVELHYVVDGYDLYRTYDGNMKEEFHGSDIREVIDAAMKEKGK